MTPYETAVKNLFATKFSSSAENYCNEFMQNYLDVNSAADSMMRRKTDVKKEITTEQNEFKFPSGLASYMFVMGIEHIEWLETWRQTKTYDGENRYAVLDSLMSTLRQVAKGKENQKYGYGQAAFSQKSGSASVKRESKGKEMDPNADPNALCMICEHTHINKKFYVQHPELRGKKNRKNKPGRVKGSARAAIDEDNEASEGSLDDNEISLGTIASAAAKFKNRLLYDTGASHHFVRCKNDFIVLKELTKPFEFNQAVGSSTLTHYGTSCTQIGDIKLHLKNSLYSPNSACDIISAVRLKEEHGIVSAQQNELLVLA